MGNRFYDSKFSGIVESCKFGCLTLDRLFEIFIPEMLESLEGYGFELVEYETEDEVFVFDHGQVLYIAENSCKVE